MLINIDEQEEGRREYKMVCKGASQSGNISTSFFKLINYFFNFIEGSLLYRTLLFSVKLQHESTIGIHKPPPC